MKILNITTSVLAIALMAACSQASVESTADKAKEKATSVAQKTMEKTEVLAEKMTASDYDFGDIPAGAYTSEKTHAYITFQYMHQGYSRPTLRWNDFEANVDLNKEDPSASTLNVTINAASIDSGVEKFDTHLISADMFDIENHPTITFKSTSVNLASGTLTGDLMMKGVTKPLTLDAKLNKTGESRGGKAMFGISATTQLKRSDWDLGYAVPFVGDDVDITIEVEFQKAD